jgi:hypothetical protein
MPWLSRIFTRTVNPHSTSTEPLTLDTKVYTFAPHQILHIKYPDPSDPFVGIGIPQTIASWIDSDNLAMEYNRKFFFNGAQGRPQLKAIMHLTDP